ncbi:hypothetical protein [Shewanella marina]|uniref:hypothetical protein n=1 Tax=Shewanella marina TaxID=487319 RepID=UPI0011DC7A6E|nr:hypothetical protein [Shewanella marina]
MSVRSCLYERVSSPLFGTFVMSWCFFNHKLILLVLSSEKYSDKIKIMNSELYPSESIYCLFLFVLPFMAACVFIYLYPIAANFAYAYSEKKNAELRNIKLKYDDTVPLSLEASIKLKRLCFDNEAMLQEKIDDLNNKLEQTKIAVNEKANEVNKLEVFVVELENKILSLNDRNEQNIKSLKLKNEGLHQELDIIKSERDDMKISYDRLRDIVDNRFSQVKIKNNPDEVYTNNEKVILNNVVNLDSLTDDDIFKLIGAKNKTQIIKGKKIIEDLLEKKLISRNFDGSGYYYVATPKGESAYLELNDSIN